MDEDNAHLPECSLLYEAERCPKAATMQTEKEGTYVMDAFKAQLVKVVGRLPYFVPHWSKPLLRFFSGPLLKLYSDSYRSLYSSIKDEILVKTPMGPYIYVRYWDLVERECAIGTWERTYMNFFRSRIKKGDVVVDVGAYIGIFSLLASGLVGSSGLVYSFEPVPNSYQRLVRNLDANNAKNVRAYNLGLSDKKEKVCLAVPREIPAEASLSRVGTWSELTKRMKLHKDMVEAELVPFDELAKANELREINIVKVDAEGAELKVLEGMKSTLTENDLVLFLELLPTLLNLTGGSISEVILLLIECGFTTMCYPELGWKRNISGLGETDIAATFGDLASAGNYVFSKRCD